MRAGNDDAGPVRALEALVQRNGVRVRLLVPVPATAGDEAEQLGLATPAFTEVELGRGVLRTNGTLLLNASAVKAECNGQGTTSVTALFAGAAGVLVGDEQRALKAWQALRVGDGVYGYLLTLQPASAMKA